MNKFDEILLRVCCYIYYITTLVFVSIVLGMTLTWFLTGWSPTEQLDAIRTFILER